MIPKASPAFAPPDMRAVAVAAVGEALVLEIAPTVGVEGCDVNGAAVVLATGVDEDVLELLVDCESDVVLGAADSVLSACSVEVGAEDSVGCGSGVGVALLDFEVATGAPT